MADSQFTKSRTNGQEEITLESSMSDEQIGDINADTEVWLSPSYPIDEDILAQATLALDDSQSYCELAMAFEGQKVFPHDSHFLMHEAINHAALNHQHCVLVMPPEIGKLLRDDEQMPTPRGWARLDSLKIGDEVFGADGKPTRITNIFTNPTPELRRIYFSDGTHIDACVDHQWLTRTRYVREPSVVTTAQIERTLFTKEPRPNHSIPLCKPLQIPEADLPIEPWCLGYWLGNGSRNYASITVHSDDLEFVREQYIIAGFPCTEGRPASNGSHSHTIYVKGLLKKLRNIGVLSDKHIPKSYLWASEGQRRMLLSGLLDSDGYAGGPRGQIELCFTNRTLAEGSLHIMRSLGYKPSLAASPAKYNGIITGTRYRIHLTMQEQLFLNPRKTSMWHQVTPQADRQKWRMIVGIEKIPSVPGRCITVDNEDHLYVAGEALVVTHNSSQISKRLVYEIGKNPKVRIGLVSASERTVKRNHSWLRKTLVSNLTSVMWPHIKPDTKRSAAGGSWSADTLFLENNQDPTVVSATLMSDVSGMRFDRLWLDDVISRDCRFSEAKRIDAHSAIMDMWLKRLTGDGLAIITNNCWSTSDTIHRVKDSKAFFSLWLGYEDCDRIFWRVYNAPPTWEYGDCGYLPLWNEVWPKERLERTRDADPPAYKRLFGQQATVADEMRLPEKSTWETYKLEDLPGPETGARLFAYLDPAGGKMAKKLDFASIVLGHLSRDKKFRVVDLWMSQCPPQEQIMMLWKMNESIKKMGWLEGIHTFWYEVLPKDEKWILLAIEYVKAKVLSDNPGVKWINLCPDYPDTTTSKESRIERLHGPTSEGDILWPEGFQDRLREPGQRGKSWSQFVVQWEDFPNGAHDDGPDSLEGCYRKALQVGPGLATYASGIVGPREIQRELADARGAANVRMELDRRTMTFKAVPVRRGRGGFFGR